MELLEFLFNKCEKLGRTFGFGFWEGFIIYSGILVIIIIKIIDIGIFKRKCKKMKKNDKLL